MQRFSPPSGLTLRAVLIAIILSLFLLMSTFYIALKLGAAPWPIIFSVIVSASFIKVLSKGRAINIHEINVAQAGGSIGGLVAAGVAFTLPGILYLNQNKGYSLEIPDIWSLSLLIMCAGILGILLSVPLKYTFIDVENLPYPAGTAGAELLKAGKTGGRELALLIIIGSVFALFTILRDMYIPAGVTIFSIESLGIFLTLLVLPIAVGGGYILGARPGFSWFAGAFIGWYLLVPVLHLNQISLETSAAYCQNLGMGMVLGSGVSFIISYVLPRIKKIFWPFFQNDKKIRVLLPAILLLAFAGLQLNQIPVAASFLTLIGVWAMVAVAARMTGETNIDPLEQFGIFIALIIMLLYNLFSIPISLPTLFIIVVFVSVACAIAGDAGHDYKSAAIIGTRFSEIIKVDIITVIITGLCAPFVFVLVQRGFTDMLFSAQMPAPQAQLVANSISGFQHPYIFTLGFIIAFIGEFINRLLAENSGKSILWMPFGIGLFLGPALAIPIALGAVIAFLVLKYQPTGYQKGIVFAASIMGAEGITGFSAGALTILDLQRSEISLILGAIFILILLSSGIMYLRLQRRP